MHMMTTLVRGVIFAATTAGEIFQVFALASTKTGIAPVQQIASADAITAL